MSFFRLLVLPLLLMARGILLTSLAGRGMCTGPLWELVSSLKHGSTCFTRRQESQVRLSCYIILIISLVVFIVSSPWCEKACFHAHSWVFQLEWKKYISVQVTMSYQIWIFIRRRNTLKDIQYRFWNNKF